MRFIHGRNGRTGALVGAVFLSLALLAPSTSLATGSHHLKMYKAERHITLDGDFDPITLSCEPGDIATDGMWRIDHVDQDEDYGANVLTAVSVYDSYGDNVDPSKWHFKFANEGTGDAQLKVWLTCLGFKTAPNTHQHSWTVSHQMSASNIPVAGGAPLAPVYTTISTSQSNYPAAQPQTCAAYDAANAGTKSVLIAPGFHINENADPLRLVGSYPIGLPAGSHNPKTWAWRFESRGNGSSVDTNWRCLKLRSSTNNSHSHRIYPRQKFGPNLLIPFNSQKEHKVVCGDHYKGMVGGFWLGSHEQWLWYLGMDPRIKARAFRFLNTDLVNTRVVDLSLLCFQDRTN